MSVRCIYCLNKKSESEFNREHVISQFLGSFKPDLVLERLVCRSCNSEFSRIEIDFAEDSYEGLYLAMCGIRCQKTVRWKGQRTQMKLSSNGDLGTFSNIFPVLDVKSSSVVPRPCLIIKNKRNALQALWFDEFVKLQNGSRRYTEIADWLSKLDKTCMHVFGNQVFTISRIVKILHDLGITYTEKVHDEFVSKDRGDMMKIEIDFKIDDIIERVIAKVAFNYFTYCASKIDLQDIVYKTDFNIIRNFILYGTKSEKGVIKLLTNEPTLYDETFTEKRRVSHQISFVFSKERIIGKVSVLGLIDYEVDIGPYMLNSESTIFGCGHNFDPFNNSIQKLHSSRIPLFGSNFTLFGR